MDFAIQNKINRRVKQLQRDGVLFLSGTVAPAESDVETQDIESLEKALNYFADKGVETLHIQPKWMGSRCQVYLFRDIEKCYAVTRNGFRIKHVDLTEVFQKLMPLFDLVGHEDREVERFILDGELLPWTALGGALIEREFVGLSTCVATEANILENLGMPEACAELKNSKDYVDYCAMYLLGTDRKTMSKTFPRFETYDNFKTIMFYSLEEERNDLELYEAQLALYAKDAPLEFRGFDILHVLNEDGTTCVERFDFNNVGMRYNILRAAEGEVLPTEVGLVALPTEYDEILAHFNWLVDNGYEGIMIKPLYPNETDAVNCMKVRNKDYLRIIYGYDYQRPEVLEQLVARKRVGKKRKLSHHEYKLGQQMLQLDPAADNYTEEFERIAKAILFEIEEEATIDLRL